MIYAIAYAVWMLTGLISIVSIVLHSTRNGWTDVARYAVLFVTLPLAIAGPLVPIVWFMELRAKSKKGI